MGRLENVSYDTWWEYWNGMENMNHVMWTCSLEPIYPAISPLRHTGCVLALCLYVFLCANQCADFVFVVFFSLCCFLFLYISASVFEHSSNNKLRRFFKSQHFTSIYFVISSRFMWWFSVVFTFRPPQWRLFNILRYFSKTNLKLPSER